MQHQCSGTTKAGERCKSFAISGSTFCLAHDPARVTDLAAYRRKGGKSRSNDARARKALTGGLRDVETVQAVLLQIFARLYKGDFDQQLASVMVRVGLGINELAKTKAQVELEARLDALEAASAAYGKRTG